MPVHVITDSSSCLPPELAEQWGITVLDLHTATEGDSATTAGLSSLELAAAYARLLERGGDEGVVALHLSKELSSTWSHAVAAAAVFDGSVDVVDTGAVGMMLGFAAIGAARVAAAGGNLAAAGAAARRVLEHAGLWLFVPNVETLAKGGRMSVGQTLLTSALAIRPILTINGGRLALAAKTRTQSKALTRLVSIAKDVVIDNPAPARLEIAVHHCEAPEEAEQLRERISTLVEEMRNPVAEERAAEGDAAVPASALTAVFHEAKQGVTRMSSRVVRGSEGPLLEPAAVPEVEVTIAEVSDSVKAHVGKGIVGFVSVVTPGDDAAAEAAPTQGVPAGDSGDPGDPGDPGDSEGLGSGAAEGSARSE